MADYHVPKGVSAETLREILSGWAAVGAAAEPRHTADVESVVDVSDAVSRQTRFLEDVGILEAEGQKHRLTADGQAVAGALATDDDERARAAFRELLTAWPPTESLRGVVRDNPTPTDELVAVLAGLTGSDVDTSRVRSGLTTLLDLYEWAGLLGRDDDGRYVLPGDDAGETAAGDEDGDRATTDSDGETGDDGDDGTMPVTVDGGPHGGTFDSPADALAADTDALVADAENAPSLDALLSELGVDDDVTPEMLSESVEATRLATSLTEEDAEDSSALELSVAADADADQLEALVRALRRGLVEDPEK
jgi:hypothetical protein